MTQDAEMIDFNELRRRVGASEQRTRTALAILRLTPVATQEDARQRRYRAEWVEAVRAEVARMQSR